jgi:hypothetical protein
MVGVPNEDRVKIVVMYVKGWAEYWWRGTGCNANIIPWHQFVRMLEDRFYDRSAYEVIGEFHNLKQTGSVNEYVDKFEELVGLVRRNNPTLPEEYFICSFVSGLKGYIQHHLQCHRPAALTQAYWFAKRLEQANPFPPKYNTFKVVAKPQKPCTKETDQKTTPNPTIAELKAEGNWNLGFLAMPRYAKASNFILS